jgi:hypothetical protein
VAIAHLSEHTFASAISTALMIIRKWAVVNKGISQTPLLEINGVRKVNWITIRVTGGAVFLSWSISGFSFQILFFNF